MVRSPGLPIENNLTKTRVLGSKSLRVCVHGPRMTVVQQRTRCGSMRANPAGVGSEATSKGTGCVGSERPSGRRPLISWSLRLGVGHQWDFPAILLATAQPVEYLKSDVG